MTLLPTSRCAKCGGPVDRESYVIGYCRATAMEWIYLCGGCEVGFREWLVAGPTTDLATLGARHCEKGSSQ